MGLLQGLKKKAGNSNSDSSPVQSAPNIDPKALEEISKCYKIDTFDEADCESCSICYPSSLQIDESPLFNSAPPMSAQILVATGKDNWKHDITTEETTWGRICKNLEAATSEISDAAGGKVRMNGTNLEVEADDCDQIQVIVLPQFASVMTSPEHCVADVVNILRTQPGASLPSNAKPVPERGFMLLCSHRQRDKRCGVTAPLMKKALDIELRHHDLFKDPGDDEPGGISVLFCNHVGGHKFAANLLIYQNQGMALMLARVKPEHAKFIIEKTLEENTVLPELVRTCNQLKSYRW